MIKLLVVEKDSFLRELLTNLLIDSLMFCVAAAVSEPARAFPLCLKYTVDLALMNICTDKDHRGGIKAAVQIKKQLPHIKVVLMTGIPETDYIKDSKAAGVDSFLYKTDSIEHLMETLIQTMRGKNIWPKSSDIPLCNIHFKLSPRENEVARLICCNCMTRQEIADQLGISPDTVKTITSRIFVKVNVQNIRQLMHFMLANDYFKPNQCNLKDPM